ncbi:GNAT family N-acetyltransferase [Pedobacter sp. SYP-B3415]|uniref:GNAT family N-acetyltransferase n=1 Tax=Pedobacter sp. SYP-B3415 TaxID=2496641 RepID=UPI00101D42F1|nr:GNAT family N-acetyltransferase [Pedobacter sp. SYP-B3415]
MTLRPYEPADRPGCLRVFYSNVPEYFAPAEIDDFTAYIDDAAQRSHHKESDWQHAYFVVSAAEDILACGGYAIHQPKAEAWLTWGMVLHRQQRMGIGQKLLMYRLKAIFTACPGVTIHLDTTQLSYRFFERAGFQVTAINKDAYGPGYDRIDMICRQPNG